MQTTFLNETTKTLTKTENASLLKRTIIELDEKRETTKPSTTKNTAERFKYPTNGLYRLL